MFKQIPGNHKYKISLNGEIATIDGSVCVPIIKDNKVLISIYGDSRYIDLQWLALLAHFEINLPEKYHRNIFDIDFLDTLKSTTNSISGKIVVFKRPMIVYDKYRIIPGFTDLAASKEGEVIETNTGRVIPNVNRGKSNYPELLVYCPDKSCYKHIKRHRLIALAWCYNTNFCLNCIINHKNGIKNDSRAINLEWVSYSRNARHAYENDLRTDNIKCKVRDFITKKVTYFSSLRDASSFMGVSSERFRSNDLYKRKSKLINDRYELKTLSDDTPWFYDGKESVVKNGRYITTIEYPDGSKETFYDLYELKQKLKIWNVSNIKDIVQKIKTIYPNYVVTVIDNYDSRPVQALNVITGEITEANTIKSLSILINRHKSNIRRGLISSEDKVFNGYAFRYKTNNEWNKKFVTIRCKPVRILATNLITNETKIFESLRKISKYFNIDRSVVRSKIDSNTQFRDWKFKEINESIC